ncbi:YqhG family protein [Paenibacillus flagellatus]|uniref:Uncharacterized protein n=1 Tax=Paenibacillus flagellatus TaxID=2211139 RepID=A0A2V5KMR9_9BACL|nr:YqhG family protein [Paenibacillus flagellatus]PYI56520.1 hypothetical protein DLM86_05990 [Paenibacillus flagellatus]
MNAKQVQKFALRYLEATGCHIIEKHPAYVTVKLSPEADKRLTNRSYYWSFVERTGAPPETMTFTFVFDPEKLRAEAEAKGAGAPPLNGAPRPGASPQVLGPSGQPLPPGAQDTILGRYFGIAPGGPATGPGRVPREEVTFGSKRLAQLFDAVKADGRWVQLFETPDPSSRVGPGPSAGYVSFLNVNVKIELACDMKRDELHSFGVNLATGELRDRFFESIAGRKLTPRLPPNVYIARPAVTLAKGRSIVEQHVERLLKRYDHRWAAAANERLRDELERVDRYYEDAVKGLEDEQRQAAEDQWRKRREELDWQYRPRIRVTVVNGGLFHLQTPLNGTN